MLAIALCGIVSVPVLLYSMHLDADERGTLIPIGVAAAVLLPTSLYLLWVARRYSVPASLVDMTANGWECVGVAPTSDGPLRTGQIPRSTSE